MPEQPSPQPPSYPRASLRNVPWGPFALGLGGIGAAHLLGYSAGGALAHGAAQIPHVKKWLRDPKNRQTAERLLRAGVIGAGTAATVAALGRSMAHQKHMAESFEKAQKRLEDKHYGEKTASVLEIYRRALELS